MRRVFAALEVRNYRYFVVGHTVSLIGGWMQIVAQGWLVLQLTGSAAALGAVAAIQTVPVLLFAPTAA
ncbi:hypothetical protein Pflav_043160 [Phytohabitans flavus]|uniref:MFS transporter n=1 Tax=Phytohabitans flavus TaxID=1076124 RepID=A0A6F8XVP8_9ACTN|nr:MFS transporter [Phytohabitans flavus]BCB77906.1 hypothetical protein Pflav_043160 [Phytohabitans flavus]